MKTALLILAVFAILVAPIAFHGHSFSVAFTCSWDKGERWPGCGGGHGRDWATTWHGGAGYQALVTDICSPTYKPKK